MAKGRRRKWIERERGEEEGNGENEDGKVASGERGKVEGKAQREEGERGNAKEREG